MEEVAYTIVCCSVTKLYPVLYNPKDYSPPGPSVHGISKARILELVAISFSKGLFVTQGLNPSFVHWQVDSSPLTTWEAQYTWLGIRYTQSNVCNHGISGKVEAIEFMKIKNNC